VTVAIVVARVVGVVRIWVCDVVDVGNATVDVLVMEDLVELVGDVFDGIESVGNLLTLLLPPGRLTLVVSTAFPVLPEVGSR
jgi:hypothetical protein